MYRKLQRNLDIIQYLLKDTSLEQLQWRKSRAAWSLGEIICHLRDVEIWHTLFKQPVRLPDSHAHDWLEDSGTIPCARSYAPADYLQALETYIQYRRLTIAFFKQVEPARWPQVAIHRLFGQVLLAELPGKIHQYDQAYIYQMETVIREMPLNPLLARALTEIEQYHQRYRPFLIGADSLLDIGVGSGLALRYLMLQHPHIKYSGVDIQDSRRPEIEVPLQVYDGRKLPFAAKCFDVSLLFYVLHHCQAPHQVLAEAVRVTRQTLIIIEEFTDPDADQTSLDLTERESHRALGLPSDLPYQLFGRAEFEVMLKAHRLTLLKLQHLPSRTTRSVQKYLYVMSTNTV